MVLSRKTSSLQIVTVTRSFTAMTRQSLDTDNPVINNSGAVIDFYGPCDENPVGKDQIQDQELEAQHRFTNDYED